ncbi:hypothetical protein [Candidatus Amarolinea dominans]|nr:hypothetical protein [Anaerolineae bacterium]MBK9230321.1 hypothetical protein [Anaerolineae bacterium]
MVEPSSLQNQVCLVTGATAGLGKAAAVQERRWAESARLAGSGEEDAG